MLRGSAVIQTVPASVMMLARAVWMVLIGVRIADARWIDRSDHRLSTSGPDPHTTAHMRYYLR
jgi:hypothetical protein